jgi:hypothetical protein
LLSKGGNSLLDREEYQEFHTSEEAYIWGIHNFGEWVRELNSRKSKIENSLYNLLYSYTGNMYKLYNLYLRGLNVFDCDTIRKYSKDTTIIADELRKFQLKENIITYRYTKKHLFKLLFYPSTPKNGLTFTDKGFMSTTLVPNVLKNFAKEHQCNCLLKLYLPKGTKGAYIKFDDSSLNEHEFLLPPNSKFVLIKKHLSLRFQTVYECKLIGQ